MSDPPSPSPQVRRSYFTVTATTPLSAVPRFPADTILECGLQQNAQGSRSSSPIEKTLGEADKTRKEIAAVHCMLTRLEAARSSFNDGEDRNNLVKNLNMDEVLRVHLYKLNTKLNILEWRVLASKPNFTRLYLDPVVVDKLLDIQKDSASAVGALALVGATVAISLMYSAPRGSLWYPFIAWWMFLISMATTSGLSLANSGSSISSAGDLLTTSSSFDEPGGLDRATPRHWLWQQVSVTAVALSLVGAAGGWAVLSAGAAGYNLHKELEGNPPAVSAGPDLGPGGIRLAPRLVAYLIIGIFVIILVGGYLIRLRPRMHTRIKSYSFGDHVL